MAPAIKIASTGNLDPEYFNHPSSTVIYPLAGSYYIWNVFFYNGKFFSLERASDAIFNPNLVEFYLLGRYLVIAYAMLSVPLVYQIGRLTFNKQVGFLGAWLAILPLILKSYSQIARDDIVATFFGLLSLYFCLKLYDDPTTLKQILAGAAIGLAIATRYLMAMLVPLLLLVNLLIIWREGIFPLVKRKKFLFAALIGLITIGCVFALSTPYFFLNFSKAFADISSETRTEHLGADGLTPLENFAWYVTRAIPAGNALTLPLTIFAIIGMILVIIKSQAKSIIVLIFTLMFLVGISFLALHWQRWIIPILPLWALYAGYGIYWLIKKSTGLKPSMQFGVTVLLLAVVSAWPIYQLILDGIRLSNAHTRVAAREWMLDNLPPGSKIAAEEYTAFLRGVDRFKTAGSFSLATTGWTPDQAYRNGFRYIVVSSDVYNLFFAEPDRYQDEIKLYKDLFAQEILLKDFSPSYFERGPTIRIYQLRAR